MVEKSERYLCKSMKCKTPMRTLGRLADHFTILIQNIPCSCKDAKQQLANAD